MRDALHLNFLFAQKNYSPILKPFLLGTRSSRILHTDQKRPPPFLKKKSTYRYQQLIFLFLLGFLDFVKIAIAFSFVCKRRIKLLETVEYATKKKEAPEGNEISAAFEETITYCHDEEKKISKKTIT